MGSTSSPGIAEDAYCKNCGEQCFPNNEFCCQSCHIQYRFSGGLPASLSSAPPEDSTTPPSEPVSEPFVSSRPCNPPPAAPEPRQGHVRVGAVDMEVRIVDPDTGGQKGQKAERFDLIPPGALEELARVYGQGNDKKYDDWNWLKGYRWSLSLGAAGRHIAKFMLGQSRDAKSGCHHLAHAAWHCFTLMTFESESLGTDDRMFQVLAKLAKGAAK